MAKQMGEIAGEETKRFKDVTNGFKQDGFSEKQINFLRESGSIFGQFFGHIEDYHKWRRL